MLEEKQELCLSVEGLTKKYRGKTVVDHISFEVRNGQILGLIGTNGAGKSTTISMLCALLKPDDGRILFHGVDVWEHPGRVRQKIGYVPQEIALYESLSGMENLKFWGRAAHVHGERLKERIRAVSEMIGFTEEMLSGRVQEYSGGMKRRLNIAVALLAEPELILLDEPTVGIDGKSRRVILEAVRVLADQGAAVIYVGHYMDEVEQLCDRICMLKDGSVLINESVEGALNQPDGRVTLEELYRRME